MAKHHEEVEFQEDRSPSKLQEIGHSRIENIPENEARREEGRLSEIGDVAHFESEIAPNEERAPKKEESVIRPKRSSEAVFFEKSNEFKREILFCKHEDTEYREPPRGKSSVTCRV